MNMRTGENSTAKTTPWFDPFTRWMLIIMFALLAAIFIAAKYMDMHDMTGGGTDDAVNAMASKAAQRQVSSFHRPARGRRVGGIFRGQFLRRHDCGAQLEEAVRERDKVESKGVLEYANLPRATVPRRDTTYLHRLDGRIKTCVLLAAMVIVSVLTWWPLAAGALLVTLALMFTLRLPLKRRPMAHVRSFRRGLAGGGQSDIQHRPYGDRRQSVSGIFPCLFTGKGWTLGFLIMLRMLAAVSMSMLLSFSTPMVEILATLRFLKCLG